MRLSPSAHKSGRHRESSVSAILPLGILTTLNAQGAYEAGDSRCVPWLTLDPYG